MTDIGREVKAGDIISYVKTKTNDGVKPVGFAKPEGDRYREISGNYGSDFRSSVVVIEF